MANDLVQLTTPQKLAMMLQSTDQNAVLPSPQIANQAVPSMGGMMSPISMAQLAAKRNQMTPIDMQRANDREYDDMSFGR